MPQTVNSRSVPIASDWKDTNEDTERNALNTLLTELANILDATADSQGLHISTIQTASNVGTVESGVTAVEYGDGIHHTTVLTVAVALPAIAGGADLAVGKKLYTLPAGAAIVKSAYMSLSLDEDDGNITADTPDVGLGTTIASGVVNVLSGTAAFENILTGQTAADCNGTATVKTVADQVLVIETGDSHAVYLNAADGWAASGEDDCAVAGTVVLEWMFMA